jgi:hypothetical protein
MSGYEGFYFCAAILIICFFIAHVHLPSRISA